MSRLVKTFCLLLVWLVFIEGGAFLIFKVANGQEKLAYYKIRLAAISNYHFDKMLGLVTPRPNSTLVIPSPEYTDVFKINPVGADSIGLFDDGINSDRPVRAVAIGDSFTRGMGALDNLKFGWVELVERDLPWLDLVNMGNTASAQYQQLFFYRALETKIEHSVVLINFYAGNDFTDNANPFDINRYLNSLPPNVDKDQVLYRLQASINVSPAWERFIGSSYRPYSELLTGLALERIFPKYFLRELLDTLDLESGSLGEMPDKGEIPMAIRTLALTELKNSVCKPEAEWTFCIGELLRKNSQSAQVLAKHSAEMIRKTVEFVRAKGRLAFLIVHPSKEQVYLSDSYQSEHELEVYQPTKILLEELQNSVATLDLTPQLRKEAFRAPAVPLYWHEDSHFTQAGYRFVADKISEFLRSRQAELSEPVRHKR